MIVLDLNENELIEMVRKGKDLESGGFSGSLFLHNGMLIKLDRNLFRTIKNSQNEKDILLRIFKYCSYERFASEQQITYLLEKQKNIKLTEFDLGVIKVSGVVCGVILANHLDYQNLGDFTIDSEEKISKLLKLLNNVLKTLKELEDNQISQTDLINRNNGKMNILYKDDDIKLCDLEGFYLKYGNDFKPNVMYQEFLKLLRYYLEQIKKFNPKIIFLLKIMNNYEINSYEDILNLFNIFVNFFTKGIQEFGYLDIDIATSKEDLFKGYKKVFCGNLVLNLSDLKNGLHLPSDIIFGNLTIDLETMENITLPNEIYGNLKLKGVEEIKNVTWSSLISEKVDLGSLKVIDGLVFRNNNLGDINLMNIREIKNTILPSGVNYSYNLYNLKVLENSKLPIEVFDLMLGSLSSLKDTLLPEKVEGTFYIEDLSVLDGAIIPPNADNYVITVSNQKYNLFDLVNLVNFKNVGFFK